MQEEVPAPVSRWAGLQDLWRQSRYEPLLWRLVLVLAYLGGALAVVLWPLWVGAAVLWWVGVL